MYQSKPPLSVRYLPFLILVAFRCANYNKLPRVLLFAQRNATKIKNIFLIYFFITSAPLGGGTFFVLSECMHENSKSTGPIYMKYGEIFDIPTRTNRLDFGATQLNI